MSTGAKSDPSPRANIGLPVIVSGILAVVAIVGFLGYQMLAPKEYAPPPPKTKPTPDPNALAFKTWAQQRYRETGGIWAKLPPEDQQRFANASRGKGQSSFESFKP